MEEMLTQIDMKRLPSYRIGLKHGVKRGVELGIERGIKRGIEQGIERGIERGLERGHLAGELALLKKLLVRKFGAIPEQALAKMEKLDAAQLEELGELLLSFEKISDVTDWLKRVK
jgi:flagellar biosynthesis/type III secretory pathway protein FliH